VQGVSEQLARVFRKQGTRPFGVRLKEHHNIRRASTTAVGDHLRDTGHNLDFSSSLVIARENDTFKRRIREAIEIHCQTPTMNRDSGYELLAIYGDVLSRGFHHPKSRDKKSAPSLDKDSATESKVSGSVKFWILRKKPCFVFE